MNTLTSTCDTWSLVQEITSVLPLSLKAGGHSLLQSLLAYNPAERISARSALQHQYLRGATEQTLPPTC